MIAYLTWNLSQLHRKILENTDEVFCVGEGIIIIVVIGQLNLFLVIEMLTHNGSDDKNIERSECRRGKISNVIGPWGGGVGFDTIMLFAARKTDYS